MKKIFLTFMVLVSCVFASDELNIDSLFKKQIGLRSITSFSLLSTGNANSYSLYPNITNGKIIGFRVRKFKDINSLQKLKDNAEELFYLDKQRVLKAKEAQSYKNLFI
ncbi:hypothetical protein MJV61_001918 [Campylobacter coli]|nr:hypothetical protein [Campylobacter coli]EIX1104034.1 hypothetical protein [Campylobacter coli]QOP69386.1 hypothetical protein DSM101856_00059 [Campylobacter coli]HEF3283312.1 hypothetical protein [Campylobacter coli]HEG2768695.1 hypothetical protein [Campylobacter coli]